MSATVLYYVSLFAFFVSMESSLGQDKVAKAILLRGEVKAKGKNTGAIRSLKQEDWVDEGDVIQTAPKSFVKFLFNDKTQLNLGPDSKMVINKFSKQEAGLISLVNGKIRSQVVKDALKEREKEEGQENKLYIKTKSAAMGIRGTDFQVVYNEENSMTSLVTFSGEVVMTQVLGDQAPLQSYQDLNRALNSEHAVKVSEGQFSGANPQQESATIPVKISPAQLETLRGNTALVESSPAASLNSNAKVFQSPIPPGINPKAIINSDGDINKQLSSTLGKDSSTDANKETGMKRSPGGENSPPPEGQYNAKTGAYAPPAGGFVDLKTGLYIPPPPGSTFDPNTGVYVPPPTMGKFDPNTGNYVPPSGFKLEASGRFVANEQASDPKARTDNSKEASKVAPKDEKKEDKGPQKPGEARAKGRSEDGKSSPPPPAVPMKGDQFIPPNLVIFVDPTSRQAQLPPPPPPRDLPPPPTVSIEDVERVRDTTFNNFQTQQQQQQQQQDIRTSPTTNVNFVISVQ